MASMRRSTGPQQSALQLALARRQIMSGALPEHSQEDDEVHLLGQFAADIPCHQQSISFSDRPPELRNRLYEEVIPCRSYDNALIVASRCNDVLMVKAVQPAITRVSKQIRAESLGLFYARSTFAAYIEDTNFTALLEWARTITQNADSLPAVLVQVCLMDRIACEFSILDLVQGWARLPPLAHEKIYLSFVKGPSYQAQSSLQRDLREGV
ncbi:hypothetical protein EJ03DRAFT_6678 [Teratosphaeria nubilosa]|uniref:Uncharacterized protein n=1 Tax=Teratosphaeria nubilosa TaxID=161662 RepID=A0A6G1LQK4_9PEZI|nr:hypothetical protein EJ03DRAFT_6678 [Teratosphaeria nubilosa]